MRFMWLVLMLAGVALAAWPGWGADARAADGGGATARAGSGGAAAPGTGNVALTAEEALALFEAYQGGYEQVVAIAAYQLYYSTGLIDTEFKNGHIDAATATFALQQNSLLHSACLTTITDVCAKTPAGDGAALAELGRIKDVLLKEDDLLRALSDLFGNPSEEAAAAAEQARQAVAAALDEYAKPAAQ